MYRPVAARCALLYFLIDSLNALDRVYHYSMANFVLALKKGARPPLAAPAPPVHARAARSQTHAARLRRARGAGMDAAPITAEEPPPADGGPDGHDADGEGARAALQRRVDLLTSTATAVIFDYVAQARRNAARPALPYPTSGAPQLRPARAARRASSSGTS